MQRRPSIDPPPRAANLQISLNLWPIVFVKVRNQLSLADADYLHTVCDQVFAVEGRHAFLVDCTGLRRAPGAEVRHKLKLFEDSRQHVSAKKGICCAIVIQSAVIRGAYTALRWISAQPVPNKAFATLGEGTRWCIEAIEREGIYVPAEAYALAGLQAKTG